MPRGRGKGDPVESKYLEAIEPGVVFWEGKEWEPTDGVVHDEND